MGTWDTRTGKGGHGDGGLRDRTWVRSSLLIPSNRMCGASGGQPSPIHTNPAPLTHPPHPLTCLSIYPPLHAPVRPSVHPRTRLSAPHSSIRPFPFSRQGLWLSGTWWAQPSAHAVALTPAVHLGRAFAHTQCPPTQEPGSDCCPLMVSCPCCPPILGARTPRPPDRGPCSRPQRGTAPEQAWTPSAAWEQGPSGLAAGL